MLNIFLLQADATPSSGPTWILLGGLFLIMYLFIFRPQIKKQKESKAFRDEVTKGQKVVTIGGIHGKIVSVSDLTVVLELESGKVRVDKNALSPTGTPDEGEVQK